MRTNIVLNDLLVEEAMKPANVKTKKEFVENYKRKNLIELKGKIKFAEGYDYKSMREGRQASKIN